MRDYPGFSPNITEHRRIKSYFIGVYGLKTEFPRLFFHYTNKQNNTDFDKITDDDKAFLGD